MLRRSAMQTLLRWGLSMYKLITHPGRLNSPFSRDVDYYCGYPPLGIIVYLGRFETEEQLHAKTLHVMANPHFRMESGIAYVVEEEVSHV